MCCGVNTTHLKALVRKDFTNLNRRRCFCFLFLVFPPLISWAALSLFDEALDVENTTINGSLIMNLFQHQSFDMVMPQQAPLASVGDSQFKYGGNIIRPQLSGQGGPNAGGCTRIMIASEDKDVREKAEAYANNFMLSSNKLLSLRSENENLPDANKTKVYPFDSLQSLNEFAKVDEEYNCFGLYFKKVDRQNFDYEVQMSFSQFRSADTNLPLLTELISKPDVTNWGKYKQTAWLYPYITDFLAKYQSGTYDFEDTSEWNQRPLVAQDIGYTPMPTSDYILADQQVFNQLQNQFVQFIQYPYLFMLIYIIQGMVGEKETKARQGMKIMGLQDGTYFLAWFIHFLFLAIYTAFWQTVFFGKIFNKVDMLLLFIFLILLSVCFFSIALLINSVTANTNAANGFAIVFFFLSYQLNTPFQNNPPPSGILYLLSIFPTIVLLRMIKLIFLFQYRTEGLTFANAGTTFDTYSVQGGILMLFFMSIVYIILGLYLDQVVPMEFGVAKPWNFCCSKGSQKRRRVNNRESGERLPDNDVPANKNKSNFEPITENMKRQLQEQTCIKVRGLKKTFGGDKWAVKGVDLTMYQGQIFALLGHNGAGKTTTLSMLTGLIDCTEGDAEVLGFNLFDDMDRLRSMLGVCPQHDILFQYLTPQDHLRMFSSFKGTPPSLIDEQVEKMLHDIDLYDQKDQPSSSLSGGQKRKLSVAISMIGNSKVIMLDEPTSGMDTTARRRLWEMLKKNKGDKIIILTTHYMDEADILGDRIAIMTEGQVECTGSSLFLKQRYGVGYQLIIEKAVQEDLPEVENFLKQEIPDIVKLQEVSGEISFQIPRENSKNFKTFFEKFDAELERLQLRSYSVGITTLEEVFLKIGHGEEEQGQEILPNSAPDQQKQLPNINVEEIENYSISTSSQKSFFNQFKEISLKKLKINIRTQQTFIQELIIPFLIIVLFVGIGQADFLQPFPGLDMSPENFNTTGVLYYNDKYSQAVCPKEPSDPEYFNLCGSIPVYKDTKPFVDNSMMCKAEACKADKLYSKTEVVQISAENLKQPDGANQTNELSEFETKVFKKRDGENAFIYIHEISHGQIKIVPNDPKTFSFASLQQGQQKQSSGNVSPQPLPYSYKPYGGTHQFDKNYEIGMGKYSLVLILNSISPHSFGIWGAYAQELILRDFFSLESAKVGAKVSLKIINDPLPLGRTFESSLSSVSGFLLGFGLGIVYIIVGPSLVKNVVQEKELNLKNQMIISGVKLHAYWFGHYVKDIIFGLILAVWIIILVAIFDINLPSAWILILLGVLAIPPCMYTISTFFQKTDGSTAIVSFYLFIFAFIGPIAIFILQLIPTTRKYAKPLKWVCSLICPQFAIINGIISISFKQFFGFLEPADKDDCEACDYSEPDPFDERIALAHLISLLASIVFWWLIVGFIDSGIWRICARVPQPQESNNFGDIDEDIINEEQSAMKSSVDQFPIRIVGAKKNFSQLQNLKCSQIEAVKRISFGLNYGECFALLGVSGAGKTTMFKMITGEILPTAGQMSIIGNNVLTAKGLMNARKYIGYCPQFDCLYPTLTVREHLELYASLKGIDIMLREQIIYKLMIDMGILEYEHVYSMNLSGGNKRKLSVSMAIMGNPPIIFLDEPSTGVDPQAKRFMWNIVSKISREKKQSSVILTTHSMEEAEALCNKMGIMVKGEFKCFGSASHIKDKYGTGFEIEFKVRNLSEQEIKEMQESCKKQNLIPFTVANAKNYLTQQGLSELANEISADGIGSSFFEAEKKKRSINSEEFLQWQFTESHGDKFIDMLTSQLNGVEIVEHWNNSWRLKVQRGNYSIGFIFGLIEDSKGKFEISEYSVAQTTLEQIFNNFAASAELKQMFKKRNNSVRRNSSHSASIIQVQKEGGHIQMLGTHGREGDIEMENLSGFQPNAIETNQVVPLDSANKMNQ